MPANLFDPIPLPLSNENDERRVFGLCEDHYHYMR